jgi:hypothetical protein
MRPPDKSHAAGRAGRHRTGKRLVGVGAGAALSAPRVRADRGRPRLRPERRSGRQYRTLSRAGRGDGSVRAGPGHGRHRRRPERSPGHTGPVFNSGMVIGDTWGGHHPADVDRPGRPQLGCSRASDLEQQLPGAGGRRTDPDGDRDCDRHTNRHGDADCDCHANGHRHNHHHGNGDRDRDRDGHSHGQCRSRRGRNGRQRRESSSARGDRGRSDRSRDRLGPPALGQRRATGLRRISSQAGSPPSNSPLTDRILCPRGDLNPHAR